MQAAIGCAQLEKLPRFIEDRKNNWRHLRDGLADLEDIFLLPEASENADPSWFGFLLTVRDEAKIERDALVPFLESRGIQTRMLFAGNILKHPCFDEMRHSGQGYRVVGTLENTDRIMERTFWIGVYPGLSSAMLDFMVGAIRDFCRR